MGEWLIMVKSLVEELQALIQSEANNYPPPQQCTITRVYADGHVDVRTDIGALVYVECIGKASKDDTGLLIYLNEERTQYVCLCINLSDIPTKTSDLINDGDGTNAFLTQHQSLTDYVQKSNGANTMTDSSAYSTIGTSANATQKQINAKIDEKLDDIYDTFLCENLLFDESEYVG